MLSRQVNAYYDLICASRSHPIAYGFATGSSNPGACLGREREGPQFELVRLFVVPSPVPRWTGRLHMAVASPTVIAFANSFRLGIH